jgi:hypothetical protein
MRCCSFYLGLVWWVVVLAPTYFGVLVTLCTWSMTLILVHAGSSLQIVEYVILGGRDLDENEGYA